LKIAISQRESVIGGSALKHDCLAQVWYKFLSKHQIIPIPNVDVDYVYDFDMLILSGGNFSFPRFHTELKLYNHAMDNNLPILGVCHGAFFIAELTGAHCEDIDGHRGFDHVIELEGEEVVVNSWHGSTIKSLGPDYTAIGVDSENNIEAFKHNYKPIWGLLWHPEIMVNPVLPKELAELLKI